MRSGRLCSSAGKQRTSSAVHWFIRRSAAISRASAPQAMTRMPRGVSMGIRQPYLGDASGATGGQQPLRSLYRNGSIATVSVRANRLAEFLVERRSADQHDEVVADPLLLH